MGERGGGRKERERKRGGGGGEGEREGKCGGGEERRERCSQEIVIYHCLDLTAVLCINIGYGSLGR